MDSVPVWTVLVVLGLVGTLAALLWNGSDRQHRKHADKIDDHETRITRLEATSVQHAHEIQGLRDKWHELVNSVTENIAQWANKMMEWWRNK